MRTGSAPAPWQWPRLDGPVAEDGDRHRATAPEASAEVERLIGEGRQEAQRIVRQAQGEAQEQADRIRSQAREEGLAEARRMADEALQATRREQIEAFETARAALLAQIDSAAQERMKALERELAGLLAAMAEKVVRRTIASDDGVVLEVVRTTIEGAAGARRMTVHVAAPEEELVRAAMAELLQAAEGPERLEIVADPSITEGGCVVETERGRFDARVETQIELLDAELRSALGS